MELDGEWRVQFIKSDHAKIQYGTAPAPVDPSQPNLYGGGYTTGNVIGIPKGAAHPAAAWLLAKYLAFNNERDRALRRRLGQRADDHLGAVGPDPGEQRALRHLPEDLRQPQHGD